MQSQPTGSVLDSRRLRSCGLGCLVSLTLFIALAVGAYFWAVTPGPQIPGDSLVGEETVGVAYLSGLHDDEAFASTVRDALRLLQEFNRRQARQSDVPFFLRWMTMRRRSVEDRDVEKAIRDVPRDVAVLFEQPPGSADPQIVVVANLNRYPRVLHLVYSVAALFQGSERFGGYRILSLGPQNSQGVVFLEDTLLWAQDKRALRAVLARHLASQTSVPTPVSDALRLRNEDWNLFGAVDNRGNLLGWLSKHESKSVPERVRTDLPPLLQHVEQLDFGLDVTSDGSLDGFFDARCDTAGHASELRALLELLMRGTAFPSLLELHESASSPELHGDFHLSDLQGRLRRFLQKNEKLEDPETG